MFQEKFRQNLAPKLGGRIYIPQVHHEFTTRKVLVTEWIEGEKLAAR
jgi:predicted unusual protein kinase regulating ubiquinone biosynthesis (AarF/ABC1/UbiB family)